LTLDEETLKKLTREVAGEMGLDCAASLVTPLAGTTTWCIYFTDGHAPYCSDFREYVGAPYEEDTIKQKIRDYLVKQHEERQS
jgi:hypothetical protein